MDTKSDIAFSLGHLVATPGALAALTHDDRLGALSRHCRGDWGDVCEEDKVANDDALKYGARLISTYTSATGEKFWIITEADRSSTTILLPDEY